MLSRVLHQLEALQADIAAVDPTHLTDAADAVAAMAVALRDVLVGADAIAAGSASAVVARHSATGG